MEKLTVKVGGRRLQGSGKKKNSRKRKRETREAEENLTRKRGKKLRTTKSGGRGKQREPERETKDVAQVMKGESWVPTKTPPKRRGKRE